MFQEVLHVGITPQEKSATKVVLYLCHHFP